MTVQFYPGPGAETRAQLPAPGAGGRVRRHGLHRVAKGFVAQGGYVPSRRELLDEKQESYVRRLPPEFNQTQHEKGTLSMARGDDPGSATTSFFIVLARTPALDKTVRGIRQGGRGPGRARQDRGGAGERRGAGHAHRGDARQARRHGRRPSVRLERQHRLRIDLDGHQVRAEVVHADAQQPDRPSCQHRSCRAASPRGARCCLPRASARRCGCA